MTAHNYWVGVVSKSHVDKALAGGFVQLNHGKAAPLERMREGDGFAYYSPRTDYPYGAPLQAFTAIGRVKSGAIFQVNEGDGFVPFRRAVDYLSASEAPIKPLLESLSFIRNKAHWGAAFRFGFLKVPEGDFALIAAAMGRDLARDFSSNDAGVAPPIGQRPASADSARAGP